MKTRTAGLLAACGIAAASIALIAFLASRGGPPRTASGAASTNIAPPDIKNLPTTTRGPDTDALMGGTGLFVQVMDRQDPTRLSSEIVSKSLEPLEAKNYRVDAPRAWIYLRDGRVVHVQSRQGRLHMPDRTREPDSGTLQGEVDIRMFAAPPPGARIDLTKDTPIVRARTETLQFDGSLGEVSTQDAIKITSARTDFDGRGLRLLINQAQERIELLRVESDGVLRHRPSAPKEAARDPQPAAQPASAAEAKPASQPIPAAAPSITAETPPTPPVPPTETFYHGVFSGPVKVIQAARSITNAESMELWAHLVDNELIPGAIAGDDKDPKAKTASPDPAPGPAESGGGAAAPVSDPAAATPSPTGEDAKISPGPAAAIDASPRTDLRAGAEDVVVTWPGVMEIRPVESRPAELAKDEVTVRFTAGPAQPVIGLDEKSSSTVTADAITYGATRRAVTLTSEKFAKLERPGQGELRAPRIGIDTSTGIVDIPTRGELIAARRGTSDAEARPRSVTWNDNAQFQFDVADGVMNESIRRATMIGSVQATDRGASLAGDSLQAWFTPDTAGRPVLQRLLVKDNAVARDARNGSLTAGTLDVAFAGPAAGEDPTPRSVSASGQVHAERDGATIDCRELDASLIRGQNGEIAVESVDARTRVKFARADGVHAESEQLHADAVKQIVDLTGDNSVVGKDADNVFGSQIRLDGLARTLEVFGAGRFEHETFDSAGLPIARADATWTKGMTFDDRRGELNAAGQVVAVNEPDPLTLETLRAERIKLFMTPLDDSEAAAIELAPTPTPAPAPSTAAPEPAVAKDGPAPIRAVLTAEAIGSDTERDDGVRATAELRRFESAAAKEAAAAPQQLQYLESSRILVDNTAGTLHTPGPGKLLVVDRRRPAGAESTPQAPGRAPDTSRGDALFDWQASMTMTRADGTCRMEKGVKMTHSALADGALTELECETLTARIREQPGDAAPAVDLSGATREMNGSLVEADATGAVYIRSRGKELLADGVKYSAEARTVEAWASPANNVTLFDPGNPSPLIARRLFWDLAKDRIEVREAGTIVAPR
ncbi:MAG: LPS export ABC transporter periplasmic protein LptC [Phycisphaerales bacterium]|nr:LPS export ABC transporter periplasmic protein LptC [Phycisphaerales bacterium]